MSKYRISADIGGTFTDIVVEPSDAPVFVGKVATTPENPAEGVINGIKELVPDLADVEFFVHGTTVGLNAFLERKGERVLLVLTAGLGDSYTIARGNRHSLYELRYQKPEQLVARRDIHEVRGRLCWDGEELEPLNLSDFEPIIKKVKAEGIKAIAVCFVHAYAYPQHELAAGKILEAKLPGVSVSLSYQVAREWREYERTSSSVMNAYVAPVVERYLSSLQQQLRDMDMQATVHIMQSSGGVSTADSARQNPVFTLLSGPVGGTIAGTALSAATSRPNLLCVDMGGTSFDLSLVIDGKANATLETELEGLPLLMSIVDIATIGTGGGSIAWMEQGAVRVGPRSAGSIPGPACYGRGGTEPTVTDANLFLGRLGAKSLLGGDMSLDTQAACAALKQLADEADMELVAFAEGILSISNAAMADAMRTITVSQGVDPREFTLVAFGGAGPMAAVFLAEELDIGEVLIPRFPGTFSAWGMLQTDLRQDFTHSFFRAADSVTVSQLNEVFVTLEQTGHDAILKEGITADRVSYVRSADMRYVGQEYTINVDIPSGDGIGCAVKNFHLAHATRYGHSSPQAPVEFVNLRVAAYGALDKFSHSMPQQAPDSEPQIGERSIIFGGTLHETPILSREQLPAGFKTVGPVIIEEQSATTVVPPDWIVQLQADGSVLLQRGGSS
ncbi:MAG: hydantoinase/oxoprolinase family protein [Gammaproteobacteria bacterium]|nr:hydantoinase/oxoprolinase family protein [Gammaproteobacteria bacterium]